jgi:hypothetical protein
MNRLGIALLNSLFAVAILVAATPARAEAKKKVITVDIHTVLGACSRTPGCHYDPSGPGLGTGCSPKVCFVCEHSKCFSIIKGKGPNKGATLGGIRLPPAPVRSSSGATGIGGHGKPVRHPVHIGTVNAPGKIKAPVAAGKSAGINHGNSHRH